MRKQFTSILIASILAIMLPVVASSQTKHKNFKGKNKASQSRVYHEERAQYNQRRNQRARTNERAGYDNRYYGYEEPGFYERNRKVINVAVTTGAGAGVGAVVGGKKGALIGAAAGAVTGLIINAKQKPKNYPYRY